MENLPQNIYFKPLSMQEMQEIEGGVDKNSLSYRIGHACGTMVGALEASCLKLLNSLVF